MWYHERRIKFTFAKVRVEDKYNSCNKLLFLVETCLKLMKGEELIAIGRHLEKDVEGL